jgi:hypothetical protein
MILSGKLLKEKEYRTSRGSWSPRNKKEEKNTI